MSKQGFDPQHNGNGSKTFRYTSFAIKILEKIISPKFTVEGVENIPYKPVLFVANHFTRSETFIIPYIIYKHTKRQVRCLADSSLFRGGLGRFLTKVGAVSTKDENRNNIIVRDLVTGDYDWMIYPEGNMVKSKDIHFERDFILQTSFGSTRAKTGSAVLALQSDLFRQEMIKAKKERKSKVMEYYYATYGIKYKDGLNNIETNIVPVSITYYPIRPGQNAIKKIAERFLKRLPKVIGEELEIEGNLLLSANINIRFGEAIKVSDYSSKARGVVGQIPFLTREIKSNLVTQYFKYRLTNKFMNVIYSNIKVNLDHIFTASIFKSEKDEIAIDYLKNVIYSAAVDIRNTHKYHIHYSINEENLFKIFENEPHAEFDSVVALAKALKIIRESEDKKSFIVDRSKITQKYNFHDIRKENTLQVIFNEFALLETANLAIKRNLNMDEDALKKEVFRKIFDTDIRNFNNDYRRYYDANLSKEKEVGIPFFLEGKNKEIGVVICHGYQSAPSEVKELANYLNNLGFPVYGVRLKGHGTAPINIQDVVYKDWYDSLQRGYCAINRICPKVILVGFSTGGLLSLLSCAKKDQDDILAVISINSALKLQDIRARFMVPGIAIWNDLLDKFNIKKAKIEYVENISENPLVNYSRNYLSGVRELGKLMNECNDNLSNIKNPALIIYSKNDPVVNPVGSKIIEQKISSKIKELIEIDAANHIIVFGQNSKKVFAEIENFISKLINKI